MYFCSLLEYFTLKLTIRKNSQTNFRDILVLTLTHVQYSQEIEFFQFIFSCTIICIADSHLYAEFPL